MAVVLTTLFTPCPNPHVAQVGCIGGGHPSALTHGSAWGPGEVGVQGGAEAQSGLFLFQVLLLLDHAENMLGRPWSVDPGPVPADGILGV